VLQPVYPEHHAVVELRWKNRWFYLWNNHGLLPEYTGKMVTECPDKWGWGAPAAE